MCGRFALVSPAELLVKILLLNRTPDLQPRFNISPTQNAPAVRVEPKTNERELSFLRWGLVPSWSKDMSKSARMINAKSETAFENPAFRKAARKRRCLIPADGFYEWKRMGKEKQPFYFHRSDKTPFAFAGLWERWIGPDEITVESYTILTTESNDIVSPIHNRMPVILPPEHYSRWLDPNIHEPAELQDLFDPYPAEEMNAYPVSSHVNNPQHDDARCIETAPSQFLF